MEALKKGTSFGAPCYLENVLAEMVIEAVPSIQMVRFVNSGTEACMGMLRLARAFTGRDKIIKFDGCYHGHADAFLVQVWREGMGRLGGLGGGWGGWGWRERGEGGGWKGEIVGRMRGGKGG